MTVLQGILLGIVQGVTEFLPVSSSGHLQIVQELIGFNDIPLLFDVFLHLATLAAVFIYFWPGIWELLKVFGRWIARKPVLDEQKETAGRRTIIAIIISTIFTGAIGVITSRYIPQMSSKIVCAGFLITSALLITSAIVEKKRCQKADAKAAQATPDAPATPDNIQKGISIKQAVAVGIMQGFGTLPGISRSGSTISGALYCGIDRSTAGNYSFIVSIPAILGAFILELKDLGEVTSGIGAAPVIAGCIAAFAAGMTALAFLMKIIKKGKLQWFAAYLIPVGILGMILLP